MRLKLDKNKVLPVVNKVLSVINRDRSPDENKLIFRRK